MPPPKKVDPPIILNITTNSLRNTTFAVEDDKFYYEVVTRFWHPNLTKLRKLDQDSGELVTIAELEREPGKQPRIRFGAENSDAEWVSASKWFEKDANKVGGIFTAKNGIKYRWKTHRRHHLQLVRVDSDSKEPLAVRYPHQRHFVVFRMSKHAYLEIKPELAESIEELIMSYLLVERMRRDSRPHIEVKMS